MLDSQSSSDGLNEKTKQKTKKSEARHSSGNGTVPTVPEGWGRAAERKESLKPSPSERHVRSQNTLSGCGLAPPARCGGSSKVSTSIFTTSLPSGLSSEWKGPSDQAR